MSCSWCGGLLLVEVTSRGRARLARLAWLLTAIVGLSVFLRLCYEGIVVAPQDALWMVLPGGMLPTMLAATAGLGVSIWGLWRCLLVTGVRVDSFWRLGPRHRLLRGTMRQR